MSADEPIITRCVEGDAEAFSAIVDQYRGPVYSFACRMVGDADEASDLARETFVRAYRALRRESQVPIIMLKGSDLLPHRFFAAIRRIWQFHALPQIDHPQIMAGSFGRKSPTHAFREFP